MQGFIHSIETMGLVDGPGVRTVVFFQGCALRCLYCHNPDTWAFAGGEAFSPQQLVEKLLRYRPYYGRDGGVTFSGGEPLQQPEFLLEVLRLCKQAGLHTCLDTSGVGRGEYADILSLVDLLLYDVKHFEPQDYQKITGSPMAETLRFLKALQASKTPIWVRHVVVPGLTDTAEHLEGLYRYLATLQRVEKVELLPYHTMGVPKYEKLGVDYPLKGVPAADPEETGRLSLAYFNRFMTEKEG